LETEVHMGVRALAVVALLMLASQAFAKADQPLRPVTITVVDLVTNKPVTEFSYALRVIVPGEVDPEQKQEKIKPIEVRSASGTFVVQVPVPCKLVLDLESPDAVPDHQQTFGSIFAVLSTDPERKFVAGLELGHHVKGIVRDSETRLPIPGAKVVAASYTDWYQSPGLFLEHAVTTDASGRFEVHGVKLELGVCAAHPDYQSKHGDRDERKARSDGEFTIELKKAVTFAVEGTVRSSAGQPVQSFTVMVGPTFDFKGGAWPHMPVRDVRDPNGHFSVMLEQSGRNRVIVKAEGHAVWEGEVDVARKSEPMTIQLRLGFGVTGRIDRPRNSRAPLVATLIPYTKPGFEEILPDKGRELTTMTAVVDANGAFRFEHVGPDGYLLRIAGKDVTPVNKLIQVEERDVDVGPIPMVGTGRIVGTFHRPDGLEEAPWRFAEISVNFAADPGASFGLTESYREFMAGEDGRFVVENAPAGINFFGDIVRSPHGVGFTWCAQVAAGKTTEVHTFQRGEDSQLALSIMVGDGSREQFELGGFKATRYPALTFWNSDATFLLEVSSPANLPSCFSWPTSRGNISERDRMVVRDVSPGTYHVRLLAAELNTQLDGNLLYEADVSVMPGSQPAKVALEAASIEGKVVGGRLGSIIAVDQKSKQRPRRVRFHGDEAFSIPFVRNGTYRLFAHDDRRGWCHGPEIDVRNGIAKAAPMKLVPGGEVRGKIVARTTCNVPDAVVAVDRDGIEIPDGSFYECGQLQFRIPHLWPGEWTVRLMAEHEVITSTRVKIAGTETITSDLVVDSKPAR
jgi:hypothetical protein